MARAVAAVAVILCLGVAQGAALAQTNVTRTANAVTGKTIRLNVVTALKKDCTLGSVGEIRIVTTPKNGSLVVKGGKAKTPATFRCPNVETPFQAVFYQSNPKFTGRDEVRYEVKTPDGQSQTVTVTITVAEKGGAPEKSDSPTLDL